MDNSQKSRVFCFSVSLAQRYCVDSLSEEANKNLFGRSYSPDGLGENLDVEVEAQGESGFLGSQVKAELDHKSFLFAEGATLEQLCFKVAQKFGSQMISLKLKSSSGVECRWSVEESDQIILVWPRPLSVIWKRTDGGVSGARWKVEMGFKGKFGSENYVLVQRSFLENDLEDFISNKEKNGWEVPDPVNRDHLVLDALFKEFEDIAHPLNSLRVEVESGKKWLIGHQTPSR